MDSSFGFQGSGAGAVIPGFTRGSADFNVTPHRWFAGRECCIWHKREIRPRLEILHRKVPRDLGSEATENAIIF